MKDFKGLVTAIDVVHSRLQMQAAQAVNLSLTVRNWMIGFFIVEFEQEGKDRADYGERLIEVLATRLAHIKGIDKRSLYRFRLFYTYYPSLQEVIPTSILKLAGGEWAFSDQGQKVGTVSPLFEEGGIAPENEGDTSENPIVGTLSPLLAEPVAAAESLEGQPQVNPQSPNATGDLRVPPKEILTKLSYSHIELLLNIPEPFKRAFYELECIKGTWNVRELKRQIQSQYFERCGFSKDPSILAAEIRKRSKPLSAKDVVKNIYAFEFLDLPLVAGIEESDLETALLDRLQLFILELGHGFCFEGRQKRILVGDQYCFLDLLFYHRILKCHVVFELKLGAFEAGDIGQLNMYLNYTQKEISEPDDRPPLGILLVAQKNEAMVRYSMPGLDERLFVQEYLLQLPSEDILREYFMRELQSLM